MTCSGWRDRLLAAYRRSPQLLDAPRPPDLLAVVRQLTLLQIDPTAAAVPSADLVAWSRLGSSYQPAQLRQALEQDRTLFEHNAMVRPMDDRGLYLADRTTWPSRETTREWLRVNDRFRGDILELLGTSGPLLSRDIPDTSVVAWPSTGWTNNRNVTQMLAARAAHSSCMPSTRTSLSPGLRPRPCTTSYRNSRPGCS